jgi:hypothetical protein
MALARLRLRTLMSGGGMHATNAHKERQHGSHFFARGEASVNSSGCVFLSLLLQREECKDKKKINALIIHV